MCFFFGRVRVSKKLRISMFRSWCQPVHPKLKSVYSQKWNSRRFSNWNLPFLGSICNARAYKDLARTSPRQPIHHDIDLKGPILWANMWCNQCTIPVQRKSARSVACWSWWRWCFRKKETKESEEFCWCPCLVFEPYPGQSPYLTPTYTCLLVK